VTERSAARAIAAGAIFLPRNRRGGTMKINDFYNIVSRRVDTEGTAISAAETKRVLSEMFQVLAAMDAAELSDTLAKGLASAAKKIGK
jgi:hypothetical protein